MSHFSDIDSVNSYYFDTNNPGGKITFKQDQDKNDNEKGHRFKKNQSKDQLNDNQYSIQKMKQNAEASLKSGRFNKAYEIYHQYVYQREAPEYKSLFNEIMQTICDEAMKYLSKNDFEKSLDILQFCEQITQPQNYLEIIPEKRCLVLNNMGCVYRRMGSLPKAFQFLEQALQLVTQNQISSMAGITYLNICAVASQLGQHDQALNYAKNGLIECQNELLRINSDPQSKFNQALVKEKVRYVAISFHNIGVEEEFLKNIEKAIDWYMKSINILEEQIGSEDPLIPKFKHSLNKAKEKLRQGINNGGQERKFSATQPNFAGKKILQRPQSTANLINPQIKSKIAMQQQQGEQNSSDEQCNFYFKNKKIHQKQQTLNENQQQQSNQAFNQTQPILKKRQLKYPDPLASDSDNVLTPKLNNYFSSKQTAFDKPNDDQTNPNDSVRGGRSLRMQSAANIRQKKRSNSRTSDRSQEREMSDLEKMGVLKWSDSEGSDGEEEQLKQKRMNFLQSLTNFKMENTNSVNQQPLISNQLLQSEYILANSQQNQQIKQPQLPQQQISQGFINSTNFNQPQTNNNQQNRQSMIKEENKLSPHKKNNSIDQNNQQQQQKPKQKEKEQKKQMTQDELKKTYEDPSKFENYEYDESKVIIIQKRQKKKQEKKKLKEEGKKILDQQRIEYEKFQKEQEMLKQKKKEEEEYKKLEMERKQREEEEELNKQRQQEELQKQYEEEERKRQEQALLDEQEKQKLEERQMQERQKEEQIRNMAIKIQRFLIQKKRIEIFKMKQRGKTKYKVYKQRQEHLQQSGKIVQRIFKLKHARQMFQIKTQAKTQKVTPEQVLMKKILPVLEVEKNIFVEKLNAPIGYYNYKASLLYGDQPEEERKLLFALKQEKAYCKEQMRQQGNIDKEQLNKREMISCTIPLKFFYSQTIFKLQELKCNNLALSMLNNVKFLVSQLTPLIYIRKKGANGHPDILIEDVTDQQEGEVEQAKVTKPSVTSLTNEDQGVYQAAQMIQRFFRGKLHRGKHKLGKSLSKKIIKTWNMTTLSAESQSETRIKLIYYKDQDKDAEFITGKLFSNRKKLNSLEWFPILKRQYPHLKAQLLSEIIDVYVQKCHLEFCDQINELLKQEKEQKNNFKKFSVIHCSDNKEVIKKLITIQRYMKKHLAKKHFKIAIESKNIKKQGESAHLTLICRKYLKEDGQSYLMALYFDQSNSTIVIKASHTTKSLVKEQINSYNQQLFDVFSKAQLFYLGQGILNKTKLKKKQNNEKKILAPRIEEVLAEIKLKIKLALGQDVDIKNETIEARKLFNIKRLRKSYNKHQSQINYCSMQSDTDFRSKFSSKAGEEYSKQIQKLFRNFKFKNEQDIVKTKDIGKAQEGQVVSEDLKQFALSIKPTTGLFCMAKLEALEEKKRHEREQVEVKKPKYTNEDGQEALLEDIKRDVLNDPETEWYFDIWYNSKYKTVLVVGLRSGPLQKELKILTINCSVLRMKTFSPSMFKHNIDDQLFKQLYYDGQNLFFKEPEKLPDEDELEELKKKKKKDLANISAQQRAMMLESSTVVSLLLTSKDGFNIEYLISCSNNYIQVNVVYNEDPKLKAELTYSLEAFDCQHLMSMMQHKSSAELQKFYKPIITNMTRYFVLKVQNRQIQTNYQRIYELLPMLLQETFAKRIQVILKARKQYYLFKFMRQLAKQKLFYIKTYYKFITGSYIEISFFLKRDNCDLTFSIARQPKRALAQQKKYYKVNLIKFNQNFTQNQKDQANKRVRADDSNLPSFFRNSKWLELTGFHNRGYYQCIMQPVILFLLSQISINIVFDKIIVETLDKRIPLVEDKSHLQTSNKRTQKRVINVNALAAKRFYNFAQAITKLFTCYRRMKKDEYIKFKLQREKDLEKSLRQVGQKIKQTFKLIRGIYYIINIYQRENVYTFDLININNKRDKKEKKVQKLRITYEHDPKKLLNIKEKTIAEYKLEQLDVVQEEEKTKDDTIKINYDVIFISKEFEDAKNEATVDIPQPEQEYKQSKIYQKTQTKDDDIPMEEIEDDGIPKTIQSNLVHYIKQKDSKSGLESLYNVVYTGKKPKLRKQQVEKQLALTPMTDENTIQIDVNLNELKKLYPTIDAKSQGLMKNLGEQLIDGIKLDETGTIRLNSSKINPHCITIKEENVNIDKLVQKNQAEQQATHTDKNDVKKILLKNTRFFSKIKYLLLIYLVERKVTKIVTATQDVVFEEYEVLYQLYCINLSNKNDTPLIWEITPEEINGFCTSSDHMESARYIMKHVQVFNQKFIFAVQQKHFVNQIRENPNVIVFYEAGLNPIQVHFKNRKYRKNYREYKEEIKKKEKDVLYKGIPMEMRTMKQYYLLVCFQKKKQWEFVAWDMVNYEKYFTDVEKEMFSKFYLQDKDLTLENIARFFEVDLTKPALVFNDQGAKEYLEKLNFDRSKSKKKKKTDIYQYKKPENKKTDESKEEDPALIKK